SKKRVLPSQATTGLSFWQNSTWLAVHVLLGLAIHRWPVLGKVHCVCAFLIGLGCALVASKPHLAAYAAAYIVAAEVLWRIAGGAIFWEFGKYSVSAILICSVLRRGNAGKWMLPTAYFLLLLPAILPTISVYGLGGARDPLSSNLSGPFCLAISLIYFSRVEFFWPQVSRVLEVSLGPLLAIAAICSSAAFNMTADDFGSESNFQASGGFGPNQVSSALGWGITVAFLWYLISRRTRWKLPVAGALLLFFVAQSALTFSRTGVFLGLFSIALGLAALAPNPRQAISMIAGAAILVAIAFFLILPALDAMTGGKLVDRFTEKGFSQRENIARADLKVFLRHPVLGTGVGLSRYARLREVGVGGMAHTEYTRLLSEHGLLGAFGLVLLGVAGIRALLKSGSPQERAFALSVLAAAYLFMAVAGMRLALPALALGLGTIRFRLTPHRSQCFPTPTNSFPVYSRHHKARIVADA
ncbi:MAG TPA: O-antigen ligase family protein, partial [Clostridia bacterium]|nr:O-antigen ligase family protein [Clostridia bacterium]